MKKTILIIAAIALIATGIIIWQRRKPTISVESTNWLNGKTVYSMSACGTAMSGTIKNGEYKEVFGNGGVKLVADFKETAKGHFYIYKNERMVKHKEIDYLYHKIEDLL